ncbi:hypothetical protein NDU88_003759 [Pleurodeles waltl]|uniref:Uncharacterized protein n=1 Tax=Pleurodeles waltl TaxID=8319 RepID=A0AAV7SGW5_PLEWA|nr:hypothetical protein NDU88_003759 [Pleurodeles waltl]
MEPNKVVQALKTLHDAGREDLIKEGVLEEAWLGLKRPERLSSGGVSAAVIACSSPPIKSKKFKCKSAEGRKVTRSPEGFKDHWPLDSGLSAALLVRKRGAGRSSRHSGGSLAQRVAAGGRGAVRLSAEAAVGKQGAQLAGARASGAACGRRAVKQAQLPRKSMGESRAAILEERVLGGTLKMAAPAGRINPLPASLEEGTLLEEKETAAREDICEDFIVISDEEQERCDGFSLGKDEVDLQSVGQFDGGVGKGGLRKQSLDGGLCREFMDGSLGSQSALKLGEHVEFVDQDGVIFRGRVCGQASGGGHKGRF